jgi:hypothetical protein
VAEVILDELFRTGQGVMNLCKLNEPSLYESGNCEEFSRLDAKVI